MGACRPGFYQVRLVPVSSRGCGPVDGSVSGQPFSTSVFPRVRPTHNHRSFSLCFRPNALASVSGEGAVMMTTLNDMTAKKVPEPSAEEDAARELVRVVKEQGLSLTGA